MVPVILKKMLLLFFKNSTVRVTKIKIGIIRILTEKKPPLILNYVLH